MATRETILTVRDLVYSAAEKFEDKDFLRFIKSGEVGRVSFRQFQQETEAIAVWTMEQSQKLGHRVRVAMLSPNNALYASVMFGVMCGGGIAVPMDPQVTQDALCNCVNRAEVDIILHHKAIAMDREVVCRRCKTVSSIFYMQDEDGCCQELLEQYRGATCSPVIQEEDCAIIIFTSGTTGVEKGVMLSHRNLIDTTFNAEFDAKSQISVLPMHHAFGLKADFLTALGIGSTTCFHNGMDKLGEALSVFQPTNLNMVPMIANALYTKIVLISQQTGKSLEECKKLVYGQNIQQIITGGAHLPSELVDKYQAIGVYIAQGYGMTECSPSISVPCMNRADKAHSGGMLVKGCETRIVDGEIQVKSPSVMMGYVNAPELTREILTEDGWLRTGDVGYVDEERFIYITGRKKNLIILSNGENVAPEQIENLLLDHQLVEECLVYGEGSQVVAEIYPNDKYAKLNRVTDIPGAVEQIIRDVNSKLVSYQKIMKHFVRRNPFVKTSTNKVVRSQRVKAEDLFIATVEERKQPTTELQRKLHRILAGILGHKDFGINTDLFSVGLDSLGCILTLTELSTQLEFYAELDELMANASVEKLEALYIKKSTEEKADHSLRPVYPLTNVQKYLVYVMRGNTTSNIPFLYQLDGGVDLVRLKAAVEALFEVHPILKATIEPYEDRGLALFRHDEWKIHIPIHSISAEAWAQTSANLVKPYLYGKGEPLYHIGLYSVEGQQFLFLDIAHAISDGMTLGILLRHLNELYEGKEVKKETYSFYEYTLDEQLRTENGSRQSNEEYFRRLMDGMKIDRSILNRRNNGDLTTGRNAAIHDTFKKLRLEQVEAFCRSSGISKNILFLTAFNYCISIFADRDDVISTSIHNGRTDSRWAAVAGALFAVYNFRCRIDESRTVAELLNTSAKQVMETMCCHISNLHADEMFIQYQGDLFSDLEIGGKPAAHIPLQLDSLPFHLMIHESGDGFIYELRYWENRFEERQLRVFLSVLESTVEGFITTDSLQELRSYIPKEHLADNRSIQMDGAMHQITIKDRYDAIQPVGAWGRLYIDGENTQKLARLLTDNTIDFLEDSGRCVMQETLIGRHFVDLSSLEAALNSFLGAKDAQAYISYGENNKLLITAELTAEQDIDCHELKQRWAESTAMYPQPSYLIVNGMKLV
ncbi:MAG: AMP-binding protein [Oscillospiraceae bacterium]|nr:AMP-binding protein [Oscillospiraceae bacterium]